MPAVNSRGRLFLGLGLPLEPRLVPSRWRGKGQLETPSGIRAAFFIYVDRNHPYVHWDHEVDLPVVRVDPDGCQVLEGRGDQAPPLGTSSNRDSGPPPDASAVISDPAAASRSAGLPPHLSGQPAVSARRHPRQRRSSAIAAFGGGPDTDIPLV
jgi:hypothetical protein